MKFNFQINEQTGHPEAVFEATLLKVSKSEIESKGENKTIFHPATVEFEAANGERVKRRAIMWDGNFKYLDPENNDKSPYTDDPANENQLVNEEGPATYQARAVITPDRDTPLLIISHLEYSGADASFADFGFDMATFKEAIKTDENAVEVTP